MNIKLAEFGIYLTGRSLASEIFMSVQPLATRSEKIIFDFSGVKSFTQSFISELLVSLRHSDIKINNVEFTSVTDSVLKSRIERELRRLHHNSDKLVA